MRLDVFQKEAWETYTAKEGGNVAAWLTILRNKKSKYKEVR